MNSQILGVIATAFAAIATYLTYQVGKRGVVNAARPELVMGDLITVGSRHFAISWIENVGSGIAFNIKLRVEGSPGVTTYLESSSSPYWISSLLKPGQRIAQTTSALNAFPI
jgi:hypothetical protein